ncbi:hypothetical protein KI387_021184 [Taxus chinensis]|uniref:Tf2-1-like SH3-like domain-containing protein n=1 Tax=Taxus chinensis TaxID=29808 RepID=A0AA38LF00_TAXCH|nr:hypothetical protein KI387_021184 [Taxus chinensis]
MYCMDQQYKWEEYLPLVEFGYNNTYHTSLKMVPFEALYGRKCRTPVSWDIIEDREVIGPEILTEMEQQIKMIREHLKEAANRKKSYVDLKLVDRNYKLGEKVFLRVKPKKSSITFGKSAKLSPHYVGPFEIVEIINPVAYRLALPPDLSQMHDVFHISLLKKYVTNLSHVLNWNSLQVQDPGIILVKPIRVLGTRQLYLRNREVNQCKVQWDQFSEESATWENLEEMRSAFPYLFDRN